MFNLKLIRGDMISIYNDFNSVKSVYSNESNMFFFLFTHLLRYILYPWTSLSSSVGIKNQPAMQETQV